MQAKNIFMVFMVLTLLACNKSDQVMPTVEVYGITSKKAVIDWSGAFHHENDLLFQVYLKDSLLAELHHEFFYVMTGLEQATTYSGQVLAWDTAANTKNAVPFSFVTQKNKEPQAFSIELSSIRGESVSLSWEKPFDPDGDVITYELLLNNVIVADSLTETSYSIGGLYPVTHHSLIVLAKDGHGNSVPRQIAFTTLESGAELSCVKETFAGVAREYGIYLPTGSGSSKLPLVINLHGWGGIVWPDMIKDYFVELAEEEQFIILMPQAMADQNGNIAWRNPLDLEFIKQLIDTVTVRHHADMERIYLTGHSNGAFMTYILGQALEYKLAAIGPIAGTLAQKDYYNYSLLKPMPLCHIHGTADSTVQVQGNPTHVSFDKILDFFIPHNNTTATPVITEMPDINIHDNSTVTRITYNTQSNSSGDIVYYRINNGNHSVPGTTSWSNKDIHAYDVLWAFFEPRKLSDK